MNKSSGALSSRLILVLAAIAMLVTTFGCADGEFRFGDPLDRQVSLSEAQHRYTVLIRWNHFKKARKYVADDDRDDFMLQTEALEEARFTEYDAEPVELDREKQSATIKVTYTLWTPFIPYEVTISEIQEWRREGVTNDWRVTSYFEDLNKLAVN
jgi:hypothetical protein